MRKHLPFFATLLLMAGTAHAQESRVQIIHNAADPGASMVDIYLGDDLAVDDFAFRAATPYLDLPAEQEIVIGVAPSTSTSSADAIATFPVTLTDGETYQVIANGVLDPGSFAVNPDGRSTGFTLWVRPQTKESADSAGMVEFIVVHGASDAPAVDVAARGVATLVSGAAYGDITDYIEVPPAAYTLDVKAAGTETVVASFSADLSGLAGGAATVLASGFLDPSSNQNGEAFGLLLVLPDGTTAQPVVVTSSEELGQIQEFELHGSYPNPSAGTTNVAFSMPSSGTVSIDVFDVRGALVARVAERQVTGGLVESIPVDLDVPSGLYLYRLEARAGSRVYRDGASFTVAH